MRVSKSSEQITKEVNLYISQRTSSLSFVSPPLLSLSLLYHIVDFRNNILSIRIVKLHLFSHLLYKNPFRSFTKIPRSVPTLLKLLLFFPLSWASLHGFLIHVLLSFSEPPTFLHFFSHIFFNLHTLPSLLPPVLGFSLPAFLKSFLSPFLLPLPSHISVLTKVLLHDTKSHIMRFMVHFMLYLENFG